MKDTALIRRVVARFKAPRTGFPPEVQPLAEKWTKEAEKRGHDLGDWKLRFKSSPDAGWIAKCVNCAIEFLIERGNGGSSALYREGGFFLNTQVPILYADEWDASTCTVEPLDIIRGIHVLMEDPAKLLAMPKGEISDTLLKMIVVNGIGPHWTNLGNRQVVEGFAHGRKGKPGVPVILHAHFRREDQRRNYKPKGFRALEDFSHEAEIHFGNKEILRLQGIEWFDGNGWVEQKLNDMKVKA